MLRRLAPVQPDSFAFTPANLAWAEAQITKYPPGRQASAVIPLLWRAQEQEGWLSRPAIEYVARMLDMAYIRVLEVATFYFMFQLQPVGTVAHVQICGTTTCMICGSGELIAVCRDRIAPTPQTLSADGRFSWEEVECLGSCANAPMAQIGKDYYEDLTGERLAAILDELAAGRVPVPGPQTGRYAAEPRTGLTSLKEFESGRTQYNASVQRAVDLGETVKRIDGSEVPLRTPWRNRGRPATPAEVAPNEPTPGAGLRADPTGITVQEAPVRSRGAVAPEAHPAPGAPAAPSEAPLIAPPAPAPAGVADAPQRAPGAAEVVPQPVLTAPERLAAPRGGKADDLQLIEGIGPKMEVLLHRLGFFHFDQIASWTAAEIAWVDANLERFRGRVTRDRWVAQAKIICEAGIEDFLRRAKTNDY